MSSPLELLEGAPLLQRRSDRAAWRRWCKLYCSGGPGGWDTAGTDRAVLGSQAIDKYQGLPGSVLVFGEPGSLRQLVCHSLPAYQAWEDYYRKSPASDALYVWEVEYQWTLVLHHEQFGGMADGPILDCHPELRVAPWEDS